MIAPMTHELKKHRNEAFKQAVGFLVATMSVLAAYLLREAIDPILHDQLPFVTFWIAVGYAVWRLGVAPAIFVVVAGYLLANYHFIQPRHEISFASEFDQVALAAYISVSTIICGLGVVMRRAQSKAKMTLQEVVTSKTQLEAEMEKRQSIQEALAKSESLFRTVLEMLPVGVWIMNERGNIVHGNPAGLAIWAGARYVGMPEYWKYKGWWVKSGRLIEAHEWAAARAISKGEVSIDEEVEIECFDGKHKFILNSGIPIKDGEKITGAIIVNQDITLRKKTEDELLRAKDQLRLQNEQLETTVNRKTSELRETLHTLEGVLYHIAHDLRAPLRAMQSFSALVLDSKASGLDEETKDLLKRIVVAARRMDELTRDLILYGRIGDLKIPFEPVRLSVVIDDCKLALSDIIRNSEAKISIKGILPEVMGNRGLLESVFSNLLSNALKFVSNAPPEIVIWSEELPTKWKINVQDNGIGIPAEYSDKIFDVFERLNLESSYPGTGMGLAIAKKAVQRMGGEIGVNSVVGQGSCFWIQLPKSVDCP